MDDNKNSFFDSKNIIAIALVAFVWIGWQTYLSKKYPHTQINEQQKATQLAETKAKNEEIVNNETKTLKNEGTASGIAVNAKNSNVVKEITTSRIESPEAAIFISSDGMSFKKIQLKKFTRRTGEPIEFGEENSSYGLFRMSIPGVAEDVNFDIKNIDNKTIEGISKIGDMQITNRFEFNPQNYSFSRQVTILNPPTNMQEVRFIMEEKKDEYKSKGFLIPSYDHQEFFVRHDSKRESVQITNSKEDIQSAYQGVSIVANASQYFTTAMMDKSEIIPEAQIFSKLNESVFRSALVYKIPNNKKEKIEIKLIGYIGPKSHDILDSVDPEMTSIVDFGYFSGIGKVLLAVLKWFNNFVGNWGVSIILLTILVRALVLPFNISSTKSMKKMQKIQPQMQAIRERYKDDPQNLQKETMALMQREKVNPLGGCLPMLLQMPIFFALFRVLGQSIELYQAPFFWWIHDLSIKDPYYVLPVLMGITLFIQQKITPTTMDPQQAKIMQFMPIIFSFMMVSLPSGLTLYTFISTLFGVVQQKILMRDGSTLSRKHASA